MKPLAERMRPQTLDQYIGQQIEGMVKELFAGNGAVCATLQKYVH